MILDFFIVESASNPSKTGLECTIEVPEGFHVPRVGEVCYVPYGDRVKLPFIVHRVTTKYVKDASVGGPLGGSSVHQYYTRVSVDLRN